MEILIQTSGWVGSFLIILAYFLVSYKKVDASSRAYQAMNLFGALGVGVNVFHQEAWPAVALQLVWGVIAVLALAKKQEGK